MSQRIDPREKARQLAREAASSLIRKGPSWTVETLAKAVKSGNREALAQAITWVESTKREHQPQIEQLLEQTAERTEALRIGITGIPGAGKSTLIERFGMDAIEKGWKVAVLAVDPSSNRTKGALLGDKTRMQQLSKHAHAFVRPSPSSTTLGGVSRATAEAIQLCEAAGFNLILVETVGIGQSEVTVRGMVDMFVLLLIGGAGDDVQGIKRGVVEMADLMVVHKAESDRKKECQRTASSYLQALHLLPPPPSASEVPVLLVSSLTGEGHPELWDAITQLQASWKKSGWWNQQRQGQREEAMHRHAKQLLIERQMQEKSQWYAQLEAQVSEGAISPYAAARKWIEGHAD